MTTQIDTTSDDQSMASTASSEASPSRKKARVVRAAACFAAVAALALVAWFRLPAITRETVWAEDGGVFLRDVLSLGKLRSIPTPYDGYLHIVPRTLASIASTVAPIDAYATTMALFSCVVVAGVAVAVFFLSKSVLEPVPLRAMLAAIPILLPVGPEEVLGNAANIHWFLLWLAPWLLLYKPATKPRKLLLATVALATAASEIIAGMFLPLAVWVIIRRKNYWPASGLILGMALQLLATIIKPRSQSVTAGEGLDPLSVFYGFFLLPVGSIWEHDSKSLGSNIETFGGWSLFIPTALLLIVVVYTVAVGRPALKLGALGALGAAVICWTASVVVNGDSMFGYVNYTDADWTIGFAYMRYAAGPALFLLTLVPLFFAAVSERCKSAGMPLGAVAGLFVVFLLGSYFPAHSAHSPRSLGPSWATGVEAARTACESNPALDSTSVLVAPISWKFAEVKIQCELLTKPRVQRPGWRGPMRTGADAEIRPRAPTCSAAGSAALPDPRSPGLT